MTEEDIRYVEQAAETDIHTFYTWGKWKRIRKRSAAAGHMNARCVVRRGKYTKATTVHHELREETSRAGIGKYYAGTGKRKETSLSLCHDCHEEVHGYRKKKEKEAVNGRKMGLRSRKTQQETKHERKTDGRTPPCRKNHILISPHGDRAEVSTF